MKFLFLFILFFNLTGNSQNNCIPNLKLISRSGFAIYGDQKYGLPFGAKITLDSSKFFIKFDENPTKESVTLFIKSVESCQKLNSTNFISVYRCFSEESYLDTVAKFNSRAILIRHNDKYTFEFIYNEGVDTRMSFEMIEEKKKVLVRKK